MKNTEKEMLIIRETEFKRARVHYPKEFKSLMKLVCDYEDTLIFSESVKDAYHPKCRWAIEGGSEMLEEKLLRLEKEITRNVIHLSDLCRKNNYIKKRILRVYVNTSSVYQCSVVASQASSLLDETARTCASIRIAEIVMQKVSDN